MSLYDSDYYEKGVQLGISGYSNYRWLPDLTVPMCTRIVEYLQIEKSHSILDFGCAKGFTVRAFTDLGYQCYGTDISGYAIENCDASVRDRVSIFTGKQSISEMVDFERFDLVISKDVFEHISYESIGYILRLLSSMSDRVFCVVPLGKDGKYVIPEYESDVTHIIREDMEWWCQTFSNNGLNVQSTSYRVPGIKDNWSHYEHGNGFFVLGSTDSE